MAHRPARTYSNQHLWRISTKPRNQWKPSSLKCILHQRPTIPATPGELSVYPDKWRQRSHIYHRGGDQRSASLPEKGPEKGQNSTNRSIYRGRTSAKFHHGTTGEWRKCRCPGNLFRTSLSRPVISPQFLYSPVVSSMWVFERIGGDRQEKGKGIQ